MRSENSLCLIYEFYGSIGKNSGDFIVQLFPSIERLRM